MDFKVEPIKRPIKPGPENHPWFWNPGRAAFRRPSDSFNEQLHKIDPDLEAVWNPVQERWGIWVKSPRLQTEICQGWRLLFIHNNRAGGYMPLDETVFARIYTIDSHRVGDARKYFDRMVSEMERDKEYAENQYRQDTIDAAMPSFDHSQISISMRGKSNGSKFSTYHS